jgi:hypothetical protein
MDLQPLTSAGQVDAMVSSLVVFALGGLLPGLLLTLSITLLSWNRQRAQQARDSVHSDSRLAPGFAVLKGTVEVLEGAAYAVRVRIWQSGVEWKSKQGLNHRWTEDQRVVEPLAFYLVQRSGQRIRVTPDKSVMLVDALDRSEPLGLDRRIVTAELSHGETVVANGILSRESDPKAAPASYRSSVGTGWVLRPANNDTMLLSAEPLDHRYSKRASVHRTWAFIFSGLLLVLNGLLFGNYHLLSVFGDVEQARVERTRKWTTSNKGKLTPHFGVEAVYKSSDGVSEVLSDEISYEAYVNLSRLPATNTARTIPFRVVSFWPSRHQVGSRPTLSVFVVLLSALANAGCLIGYVAHARSTRPWYDKRRVTHHGKGPLIASALDD